MFGYISTGRAATALVFGLTIHASLATAETPPTESGTALPALVRATPRAERLPLLSDEARALVAELDGRARGAHLSLQLWQAHRRDILVRVALEVQSLLHQTRGN